MDGTPGGTDRPSLIERAIGRKSQASLVEKAAEKLNFLVGDDTRPPPADDMRPPPAADPASPAAGVAAVAEAAAPVTARSAAEPGRDSGAGFGVAVAPATMPAAGWQDDVPANPVAPRPVAPRPAAPATVVAAGGDGDHDTGFGKAPLPVSRSRHAAVDFSRLATRGIMTPDTLRTKTTEEFRLLKRTVLSKRWQSDTRNANLIMVTSALPSEGKTFVSINLAISIACERDLRVLLVDADVSRPSIPETLGIEVDRGLVDVLTDDSVNLADVLIRTNIDGLTLLPSGRQHHLSTELLASHRMAEFTEDIAQRYADRIIIFDTPPVLATSEPSALAQHVGQIIFVVRAERTSGAAVRAAMEIIGDNPNIGFVLNHSRPQFGSASFGYYYYKGYYYHQY